MKYKDREKKNDVMCKSLSKATECWMRWVLGTPQTGKGT